MTLEDMQKRLQRIEDLEAIKGLRAEYCRAADDNFNAERMAKLYTNDGLWDGGKDGGRYEGKEAIKGFLRQLSTIYIFSLHYCAQAPQIVLEGDKASGSWYGLVLTTNKERCAFWSGIIYEEKYVKVSGQWLIKETRARHLFVTPFEESWAKQGK